MTRPRRKTRPAARRIAPAGPPRLSLVRPVTLVEQIVEALVRAAAEGRFLPGDRLNEIEIARELNVSRVPVREALRLLESQGIAVKTTTARGLALMQVDQRHLHEILVVRTSLEQLAAREAVAAYARDTSAFDALERAVATMERTTRDNNGYEHARADTGFHRALCAISGNAVLLSIWETLSRKLTIIFGLATLQKDLESIYREHVDLLDVLKSGNLAAIDRAIHQHIIEMTEQLDFKAFFAKRRARV
jgi:DNA-binding GntR family transcriptional regulator